MTTEQEIKLFELFEDCIEDTLSIEPLVKDVQDIIGKSPIEQVREFHERFEHPVNTKWTYDSQVARMRIRLIFEELLEIVEGLGKDTSTVLQEMRIKIEMRTRIDTAIPSLTGAAPSPTQILDGLLDLEYVLHGTSLAFGFTEVHDEAFKAVHRSNMSKATRTEAEHNEALAAFPDAEVKQLQDGSRIYLRKEDGKVLKPPCYHRFVPYIFVERVIG